MVRINHQTGEMNDRVFGDMYPLENIIFRSLSSRDWNYNTQRQKPYDKRWGGVGYQGDRDGGLLDRRYGEGAFGRVGIG